MCIAKLLRLRVQKEKPTRCN